MTKLDLVTSSTNHRNLSGPLIITPRFFSTGLSQVRTQQTILTDDFHPCTFCSTIRFLLLPSVRRPGEGRGFTDLEPVERKGRLNLDLTNKIFYSP